ncbi:MAG: hypothetical protein HBSIN02_00050 [Bacteroidia bacterium]|nr:MAG: hypothetical protein HBSIN02_00050 [Bacteroidia bacterium]
MVGRVLIVDDEDTLRLTIKTRLASAGFETESAVDGEEALEKLKGSPFDVVLLDINMPRMDGITALGEIADLYPQTDVIMLTGFADFSTAIECLKKGAKDYLVKPIDTTELITRLRSLLRARTSEAALAEIRGKHAAFLFDGVLDRLVRVSRLVDGLENGDFGKTTKDQQGALAAVRDELAEVLDSLRGAIEPSHLTPMHAAEGGKAVAVDKVLSSAVSAIQPFLKMSGVKADVATGSKGTKAVGDPVSLQRGFENVLVALILAAGKSSVIKAHESGSDTVQIDLTIDKPSETGKKALLQAAEPVAGARSDLKSLSDAAVLVQVARRTFEQHGGSVEVKTSQGAVTVECRLAAHKKA